MNGKKKWVAIAGVALGLPSLILGTTYIVWILHEQGLINKLVAFLLIILVVLNSFYLMFYYAIKKKD